MEHALSPTWYVFALRGAAGIVFGVLALAWPGLSLVALVALFAAYALVGGVAALAGALRHRGGDERWPGLLLGAVSIVAGVVAVLRPGLTALVLVLLMGANALVAGVLDLLVALRLRHTPRVAWLLGLAGVASLAFGVLVFLYPVAGALALAWLVGAWACASGALLLALALRLRAVRGARTQAPRPERRVHPDRRAAPAP